MSKKEDISTRGSHPSTEENARFLTLWPRGVGFHSKKEEQISPDSELSEEIEKYRKRAHEILHPLRLGPQRRKTAKCNKNAAATQPQRTDRTEKHFICKSAYILQNKETAFGKQEIAYLLADSGTLFSRDYQVFFDNHQIELENKKRLGPLGNLENQRHTAIDIVLEKLDISDLRTKYKTMLEKIQLRSGQKRKSLSELAAELLNAYYPDEIRVVGKDQELVEKNNRAIAILNANEWLGGTDLSGVEARLFFEQVLPVYHYWMDRFKTATESTGHFKKEYRMWQVENFKKEAKRQKGLARLFLHTMVLKNIAQNQQLYQKITCPFDIESFSTYPTEQAAMLSPKQIAAIQDATKRFLRTTRSKRTMAEEEEARMVSLITQVYATTKKDQTFPFYYLLLCVSGTGRIFAKTQWISYENVKSFIEYPYREKPDKKTQRISRMQFLMDLMDALKLQSEDCEKNWRLLLRLHVAVAESEETAAIVDEPSTWVNAVYKQYLTDCLPVEEWTLYSYPSAHKLTLGGYSRFLKDNRTVVDTCVMQILDDPEWNGVIETYLDYWSAPILDPQDARKLCKDAAAIIFWDEWDVGLWNFSKELYTAKKLQPEQHEQTGQPKRPERDVTTDVEVLKSLIVETAIRTILTDQARDVLRGKLAELLSIRNVTSEI